MTPSLWQGLKCPTAGTPFQTLCPRIGKNRKLVSDKVKVMAEPGTDFIPTIRSDP